MAGRVSPVHHTTDGNSTDGPSTLSLQLIYGKTDFTFTPSITQAVPLSSPMEQLGQELRGFLYHNHTAPGEEDLFFSFRLNL